MVISFDLDDLLIPGTKKFDTESQNLFQKITGVEKIRKGTIALFRELRERGHSIYIYTSSYRKQSSINFIFKSHGIPVDFAINRQIHNKELKERKNISSKLPSAFGIDLHIDDSDGVAIEGERFNFRIIIIKEDDCNWIKSILNKI
ncbi:MAG: hypothetical protein IAF38_13160 [Bacteroidia bacterium]|nr:hypothetical protein [Bacteroidia bacterium]